MKKIKLLFLYPNEMNIYGDRGNLLVLQKRLAWRGYEVETVYHHPGTAFDNSADLILGGGGQDSGQSKIQADLKKIGPKLKQMALDKVPMLMICGMYQLFGNRFITRSNGTIDGIGLFDIETKAGKKRLIGNVVVDSAFGQLVGFENHSGETFLGADVQPIGKVLKGMGNNRSDKHEGAVLNNVFGSYLHGPLLPRNPIFTDYLLAQAIANRYGPKRLADLTNQFEVGARNYGLRVAGGN